MRQIILGVLLLAFVVMMFMTTKTPAQFMAVTMIILGGACFLIPEWLAYKRTQKRMKKK